MRGVIATEQDISSLTYGLKGKLDATLQVETVMPGGGGGGMSLPVPLELKTGKRTRYNINEHNAQAAPTRHSGPDSPSPPSPPTSPPYPNP